MEQRRRPPFMVSKLYYENNNRKKGCAHKTKKLFRRKLCMGLGLVWCPIFTLLQKKCRLLCDVLSIAWWMPFTTILNGHNISTTVTLRILYPIWLSLPHISWDKGTPKLEPHPNTFISVFSIIYFKKLFVIISTDFACVNVVVSGNFTIFFNEKI